MCKSALRTSVVSGRLTRLCFETVETGTRTVKVRPEACRRERFKERVRGKKRGSKCPINKVRAFRTFSTLPFHSSFPIHSPFFNKEAPLPKGPLSGRKEKNLNIMRNPGRWLQKKPLKARLISGVYSFCRFILSCVILLSFWYCYCLCLKIELDLNLFLVKIQSMILGKGIYFLLHRIGCSGGLALFVSFAFKALFHWDEIFFSQLIFWMDNPHAAPEAGPSNQASSSSPLESIYSGYRARQGRCQFA